MRHPYHRTAESGLTVDEGHDLVEAGLVAVGGIDLERGNIQRDPGKRGRAWSYPIPPDR